jgi:hypothetical protein
MDRKEQLRIALHECFHALVGMQSGVIHKVTIWPSGETNISFHLHPVTLARRYARTPEQTHRQMVSILAAHVAPHVLMHSRLEGADFAMVAQWQTAYAAVPEAALAWKTVLDEARTAVRQWYATPGRRELVGRVATALEKRVCVHGDARWRAFVQTCLPARQAPRSKGLDLNKAVENIQCLMDSLYDWRAGGHGRTGVVLQSW